MNDSELRTFCREHAGEELPPEAIALLHRDPALRREVDQLVAVRRLMSLKSHERPMTGAADRCLRAVNQRIDAREQISIIDTIRSWFTYDTPSPALAYLAVALAIGVFGAVIARNGSLPESPSASAVKAEPVIAPVEVATILETNLQEVAAQATAIEKPVIMLRMPPHTIPDAPGGGLTFGGDASVPVSYEP